MNTPARHHIAWVAAGIRTAARDLGVDLPGDYARRVAAETLTRCEQAGVTRLGRGVVIHTVPDDERTLPVVTGYAEPGGQWYRDGSRHRTPPVSPSAADPNLGSPEMVRR